MSDEKQAVLNHYMSEVEKVKQGQANALDVGTDLKEFVVAAEGLYNELKDFIVEERDKYSEKEDVIRNGYEIRNQTRSYPQYKEDDEYVYLDQKRKNRKELIKRATEKGKPLTDSETGEMAEPVSVKTRTYPVLKYVGNNEVAQ